MKLSPVMLRSLWEYRGFVFGAVRREVQAKYRGSLLGAAWVFLAPLAQILVFTLIFAEIMRARLPGHEGSVFAYSVYLCAGVLPWGLFAEVLTRLNGVFLENANLIKKASFPRIALPVIVLLTALFNFAVILMLFLGFLAVTGAMPGLELIGLVPVLATQVTLAAGLGLLLGTLNVFFRDVAQFTSVVLGFWFWLTPIVYVAESLPPRAQSLIALNPLTPIVRASQDIFVDKAWPDFGSIAPVALVSVLLLLLSGRFFLKRAPDLVDEL